MDEETGDATQRSLKLQRQRLIMGAVSLVVAVVYTQQSTHLNFGSLDRPGAGTFPLLLGVLFIIASIVAIVEPLRAIRRGGGRDATIVDVMGGEEISEAVAGTKETGGDPRRVVWYFAWLVGYVVVLPVLGFTITNAVFIVGVALTLGVRLSVRSRINAVIVGLLISALVTWFFQSFLGAGMPRGMIL